MGERPWEGELDCTCLPLEVRLEREYDRKLQLQREWAKEFPQSKLFCQHYLLLRELYFDTNAQDTLPQTVERVLDTFLQERTGSYFLNDAVFSSANKLLDDTVKQLTALTLLLG